jgi:hypothetical protein
MMATACRSRAIVAGAELASNYTVLLTTSDTKTLPSRVAVDDDPARMADIAARLTADANYASQYRLRLIAADMIRPAGHGHVTYTLPNLRDYLREHAASAGL